MSQQFPKRSEVYISPMFFDALCAEQMADNKKLSFFSRHPGMSASVYEVGSQNTVCTVADLIDDTSDSGEPKCR